MRKALLAAAVIALSSVTSQAAIEITEVDPSGSSGTSNTYNADWFELTNTGNSAVGISGWKMDDNSHAFASAVAIRNVTSIAPGQSVVFVEGTADGTGDSTLDANFESFWFGNNVPAGFTIGNYGGTSVGLSQTADEVNIYDSSGNEVIGVGFGATTTGISLDNAAGLGNTTQPDTIISTSSVVGTNGAFSSANVGSASTHEVGSPGVVPEPTTLGLLSAAGILFIRRRRA